ncbi:MAG: signal peptidase I [Armatimonadetes bacterium 55-13]|nr:signal peptidase I [Armatimonadota bacterium]OJU62873.1 MAG: signal peptidase I [Armatimonadetes bacterium 55-13]
MLVRDFLAHRLFKLGVWIVLLVSAYLLQPYRAVIFVGNSMSPTYRNLEVALASTDISHIHKGDVVVIEGPEGIIVKRIAYMPGDWVDKFEFQGEWYYTDGYVVSPHSLDKLGSRVKRGQAWIPGGYIFVLGDNAVESVDSRQLGAIPISSIRCVLVHPKSGANS